MLIDTNTTYYVIDHPANKIIIFDDNWQFLKFVNFPNPNYLITVNTSLYITGDLNIWKTDKYLNISKQYSGNACLYYIGIFYDQTNQTFYVTSGSYTIGLFSYDFVYISSISLSVSTVTWAITEYNNSLYVGTTKGSILKIQNNAILQTIPVCSANTYIDSFDLDEYGYMAITCYTDNTLYLYYANGTSASKTLTVSLPEYSSFDSKGRYIILSNSHISIYC